MIIEFGSQYVQHFLAHRYKKNDLTKTKVSTDAKKDSESGIISENPRRKCNHTIDYIIRLECLVLAPYNMMVSIMTLCYQPSLSNPTHSFEHYPNQFTQFQPSTFFSNQTHQLFLVLYSFQFKTEVYSWRDMANCQMQRSIKEI